MRRATPEECFPLSGIRFARVGTVWGTEQPTWQNWKRLVAIVIALLAIPSTGAAQQPPPTVVGAVNAASYMQSGLPNGKLAQGGMFVLFGTGMGPAALVEARTFPLLTDFEGTSVRVTSGANSADCILFYTSGGQVAALMPSSVPTGSATLTVTYNGQTSEPLAVEVTASNFGIFAVNQRGDGPGIFLDAFTNRAVLPATPTNPGDMIDIWGTGLGPVAGNEGAGPLPGDLTNVDVEVLVANRPAEVLYRGRSGCCAGIDQIRFLVPGGILGCHVPIVVTVQGVPSNFTTLPITQPGSVCSDPPPPGEETRSGLITLSRNQVQGTSSVVLRVDSVTATFARSSLQGSLQITAGAGSCVVNQFPSGTPGQAVRLDAGVLSLNTPGASYELRQVGTGEYGLTFWPEVFQVEGVIGDGTLLGQGLHAITGTGGSNIGPFTAHFLIPELFNWTNREAISVIDRSRPLVVTWSNGTIDNIVRITGSSFLTTNGSSGAVFTCLADALSGSFTIPEVVLKSLPASPTLMGGIPGGNLSVSHFRVGATFSATGLDSGRTVGLDVISKTARYH